MTNNKLKIKKFLRQQVEWFKNGWITESNLLFKFADCRDNYPDFDYELEYNKIVKELRLELDGLKLEAKK